MNKLKVLHCVSTLGVGGAEKCAKNLAIQQKDHGQDVAILSFGSPGDAFQPVIEKVGVQVFNVRGNMLQRNLSLLKLLNKFDVIHVHSPVVIRAFIFLSPLLILKQVIYTLHGEHSAKLPGMKFAHRIARAYINQSFAISEKVRLGVGSRYGWNVNKLITIGNGVPTSQVKSDLGCSEKLGLGMVARLVELKMIDQVIQLFKDSNFSKTNTLHIFGDGPEREKLESLIDKLGLGESIKMYGNVLNENDIYKDIDCLIINSNTEGLPMSLLEAMGRGIPAIATKVGAIPATIKQGENGFLVDCDDVAALVNNIRGLNEGRDKLKMLGENAHQYIEDHFSISEIASQYLKSYQR